jgi:hypothetical protein
MPIYKSHDGRLVNITADEAVALGYDIPDTTEVADRMAKDERARDWTQSIKAAGEGAASGLTFGLSDLAASELAPDYYDEMQQRADENSFARGVGEVGGTVLPALFSGGSSLAAKGGLGAAKVGLRYLPGSVIARAAEGAGVRAAARIGGEGVGAAIARGATRMGVEGAIEGAAQGVGGAIRDTARTHDYETLAERAIAGGGLGALTGGGLGGALGAGVGAVGAGAKSAVGIFKRTLGRADDAVEGVADGGASGKTWAGAKEDEHTLKAIGFTPPQVTKLYDDNAMGLVTDAAKKFRLVELGDTKGGEAIIARVDKAVKEVGEDILGSFRKKASEVQEMAPEFKPDIKSLRSSVKSLEDSIEGGFATPEVRKQVRVIKKYMDDIEREAGQSADPLTSRTIKELETKLGKTKKDITYKLDDLPELKRARYAIDPADPKAAQLDEAIYGLTATGRPVKMDNPEYNLLRAEIDELKLNARTKGLTSDRLQDIKKSIRDSNQGKNGFGKTVWKDNTDLIKKFHDKIEEANADAINRSLESIGEADAIAYKTAKRDYAGLARIQAAVEGNYGKYNYGSGVDLGSEISGSIAGWAMGGAALGGLPAALGGAIIGAGKAALKDRYNGAMVHLMRVIDKNESLIPKMAKDTVQSFSAKSVADTALKAGKATLKAAEKTARKAASPGVPALIFAGSSADRQKHYEATKKKIADARHSALSELENPNEFYPDLATAYARKQYNAAEYLKANQPKEFFKNNKLYPNAKPEVHPIEVARFMRRVEIVEKPYNIFDHMKNNTLTKEHVETLAYCYPKLNDEIRTQVKIELDKNDSPLTPSGEATLKTLFYLHDAKDLNNKQAVFTPPPPPEKPAPPSPGGSVASAIKSVSTPLQKAGLV